MALNRPVHAPETADGTTAPAVAAVGSAVDGDLEQTLKPSPLCPLPLFWPRRAGGRS